MAALSRTGDRVIVQYGGWRDLAVRTVFDRPLLRALVPGSSSRSNINARVANRAALLSGNAINPFCSALQGKTQRLIGRLPFGLKQDGFVGAVNLSLLCRGLAEAGNPAEDDGQFDVTNVPGLLGDQVRLAVDEGAFAASWEKLSAPVNRAVNLISPRDGDEMGFALQTDATSLTLSFNMISRAGLPDLAYTGYIIRPSDSGYSLLLKGNFPARDIQILPGMNRMDLRLPLLRKHLKGKGRDLGEVMPYIAGFTKAAQFFLNRGLESGRVALDRDITIAPQIRTAVNVELGMARDLDLASKPVTFEDIGGLDGQKKAMTAWYDKWVRASGADKDAWKLALPMGFLLIGPAGTGKTMTAMAFGHHVKGAFLELSQGMTYNLEDIMERAKQLHTEEGTPVVLLIEELEKRTAEMPQIEALFKQVMSGALDFSGIILIATSNKPEALPPSMVRSGRLQILEFPVPPNEDLNSIYQLKLREKNAAFCDPAQLTAEVMDASAGLTGADIEWVVNYAINELFEPGKAPSAVPSALLLKAIAEVKKKNELAAKATGKEPVPGAPDGQEERDLRDLRNFKRQLRPGSADYEVIPTIIAEEDERLPRM